MELFVTVRKAAPQSTRARVTTRRQEKQCGQEKLVFKGLATLSG